jgi:uncharacterized phiE125 gp8 family phage protein
MIADTDFDASKLPLHLEQATREFEELTDHLTTTRTLEGYLDRFPVSGAIELERTPLVSVASVKYYDADGTEQTLDGSSYWTDLVSTPGRVVIKPSTVWPGIDGRPLAVKVTFDAGYGATESSVPEKIKHAIYSIARDRFQRLPMLDPDTTRQLDSCRWRFIYG